jgi:hypothetical protein
MSEPTIEEINYIKKSLKKRKHHIALFIDENDEVSAKITSDGKVTFVGGHRNDNGTNS